MNKLLKIADGYFRLAQSKLGVLPADIEDVAVKRFAICLQCEQLNQEDHRCGSCGCVMTAKSMCMECECPLGKWIAQSKLAAGGGASIK